MAFGGIKIYKWRENGGHNQIEKNENFITD